VVIDVGDAPAGLTVVVDGGAARVPPVRLPRGSGWHDLLFNAAGYRSKTMKIDASRDLVLAVGLSPLPHRPAVHHRPFIARTRTTPAVAPSHAAPGESPEAPTPPPPPKKKSSAITDL
jgi:hypothetical protein